MTKLIFFLSIIITILFPYYNVIYAHKLDIISWFQGEIVHIEGKFDCGKKVVGGNVKIFDSNEHILLSGKTDQQGHFSFKIDKIDNLKIVLSTPCGHKNFLKIPKNKIKTILDPIKNKSNFNSHNFYLDSKEADLMLKQIELIISQQLEDKLQPINKAIAYAEEKKIGISDVLGGIGYILGLMGLLAYIKCNRTYRKQ